MINRFRTTVFFFLFFAAFSFLYFSPVDAAPEPAGQIAHIFGQVRIKLHGSTQWQPAQVNQRLAVGDLTTFIILREPMALETFYPSRRILFKLALFF